MGTATSTLTNSSVGTPLYTSPEQAKGKPGSEQSDIYSLGVTLYEVCTGVPPFRGDSPFAIMHQQISDPLPSPGLINPALPPALEAVILRCLAKEPEQRFPSAAALTSALAETLNPSIYPLKTLVEPAHHEPTPDDTILPALSPSFASVESAHAPRSVETMPARSREGKPFTPPPRHHRLLSRYPRMSRFDHLLA